MNLRRPWARPSIRSPTGPAMGRCNTRLPLTAEWKMVSNADYSYIGRSFSGNNQPSDPRLRPSYRLINARIGFDRGPFEVALVGKNLANEVANLGDSRSIAAETPGTAAPVREPAADGRHRVQAVVLMSGTCVSGHAGRRAALVVLLLSSRPPPFAPSFRPMATDLGHGAGRADQTLGVGQRSGVPAHGGWHGHADRRRQRPVSRDVERRLGIRARAPAPRRQVHLFARDLFFSRHARCAHRRGHDLRCSYAESGEGDPDPAEAFGQHADDGERGADRR